MKFLENYYLYKKVFSNVFFKKNSVIQPDILLFSGIQKQAHLKTWSASSSLNSKDTRIMQPVDFTGFHAISHT